MEFNKIAIHTSEGMAESWAKGPITSWTTGVLLTAVDSRFAIHYTTDGTSPNKDSAVCTDGITVGGCNLDQESCIAVVKYGDRYTVDDSASYHVINQEKNILMCMFSRPVPLAVTGIAGAYPAHEEITIYSGENCNIYYTLDGSCPLDVHGMPTASAIKYDSPIEMGDFTLTVVAVDTIHKTYSKIEKRQYNIAVPSLDITSSHKSGWYKEPIAVRLESDGGEETLIRYTTDNSSPLGPMAMTYDSPVILGNCDAVTVLRAVVVTDNEISEELTRIYKFEE